MHAQLINSFNRNLYFVVRYYCIEGYFQRRNFRTIATILNFEELNFAQRHDFENKFSFLLWTNKSFVEFIFEDNMLNEIFKNKFPLKITHYTVWNVATTKC